MQVKCDNPFYSEMTSIDTILSSPDWKQFREENKEWVRKNLQMKLAKRIKEMENERKNKTSRRCINESDI